MSARKKNNRTRPARRGVAGWRCTCWVCGAEQQVPPRREKPRCWWCDTALGPDLVRDDDGRVWLRSQRPGCAYALEILIENPEQHPSLYKLPPSAYRKAGAA
jgi:hypothetical protein